MAGEVGDQFIHGVEVSDIADEAPLGIALHQPGSGQFLQVKRKGGRCHIQGLGQGSGMQPRPAGFDETAKQGEPGLLGQSRQNMEGVSCFHSSNNIKISFVYKLVEACHSSVMTISLGLASFLQSPAQREAL